ncbi:M23 family metallopeptidase [Paenibacillus lutrae]|uniref:Peptidoglycan DD-metalloendopeptidase family protein n=1 Tax=Paenibacillus lutrae TaxID=2078573 RepID=A0A7X3FLV3_9BACL|nr:M23 family metallopeptidase [Paenibacillus lutrae]MVP02101.1 peptidoglycan DD-metalloendopeptidase family protein [Paenibacillus lutrae]
MKLAAIRFAVKLVTDPKLRKAILSGILMLLLIFFALPAMFVTLMTNIFFIGESPEETEMLKSYKKYGIEQSVDWSELLIFNYVRSEMEIEKYSKEDAIQFFVYYTTHTDGDGNEYSVRHTRDLDEVMSLYPFDASQVEWAKNLQLNFKDQFPMFFEESPEEEIVPPTDSFFMWPVPDLNQVTDRFGSRILFGKPDFHYGVDINLPGEADFGKPIYATAAGTVTAVEDSSTCGKYVRIEHKEGWQSRYCHMSEHLISKGSTVKQGTKIGLVGHTGVGSGSHLHFELKKNGQILDPLPHIWNSRPGGKAP